MELLTHYSQLCQKAGEEPNSQILEILTQLKNGIPSEHDYPVQTVADEINYFERKIQFLQQQTGNADKQAYERAVNISQFLQRIQTLFQQPLDGYNDFVQVIAQLQSIQPAYTRLTQLNDALAADLARALPGDLNKRFSGVALNQLRSQDFEQLDFIFKDSLYQKFAEKNEPLQDLKARATILQQIYDSVFAIQKCVKDTNLSRLTIPDSVFSIVRRDFDQKMRELGAQMAGDEQKTADFVEKIILSSELHQTCGLLHGLRGVLKRQTVKKRLQNFQQHIDDGINQFIGTVEVDLLEMSRNKPSIHEAIIESLQKIQRYRYVIQQLYEALGSCVSDPAKLQADCRLLSEKLRLKQQDLLNIAVQILQSTVTTPPLYFTQKGTLVSWEPGTVGVGEEQRKNNVITDVISLYQAVMSGNQLGQLQNQQICLSETLSWCGGSVGSLIYASQFYNGLRNGIRIYQKPLLIESAQKLEAILRESCKTVDRRIGSAAAADDGFLRAIAAAAAAAAAACTELSKRLAALETFHKKQIQCLKRLQIAGVSDRRSAGNVVNQMKVNIEALAAAAPPQLKDVLIRYWTGGLCSILAKSYDDVLGRDLARLRALPGPIGVRADLTLEPSANHIQSFLVAQISEIARVPTDPSLQLSDKQYVTEMHAKMIDLAVNYMPKAIAHVQTIVNNLYKLQDYFVKHFGIVSIAQTRDYDKISEIIKSYEDCVTLINQSSKVSSETDVIHILQSEFPFLVERMDEKNLFTVQPSGGSVVIDVQTIVRLFGLRKEAIKQVAFMAAGLQSKKIGQSLSEKIKEYQKELKESVAGAQTSEQFKALAETLANIQHQAVKRLAEDVKSLQQFRNLFEMEAGGEVQGFEDIIAKMDSYLNEYDQLIKELSEIEVKVADKKKELYTSFQAKLGGSNGLIYQAQKLQAQMDARIESILGYVEKMIKVNSLPCSEEYNAMFKQLYTDYFELQQLLDKQAVDFEKMKEIESEIEKIDKEVHILFEVSYAELIQPNQQQSYNEAVQKLQMFTTVNRMCKFINPIETSLNKLFKMDWSAFKVNTQIFDKLNSLLDELNDELNVINSESNVPSEQQEIMQKLINLMRKYHLFLLKLLNQTQILSRQLRSPSLQKAHWGEISEKMKLLYVYKYFNDGQTISNNQIPECLNGCVFMFYVATTIFTNGVLIAGDQVSAEFKQIQNFIKQILLKAENEANVRNAIEETAIWLKQEAKILLKTHPLCDLSIQELQNVAQAFKQLPVTGSWGPFLIQLMEKKALLQSVIGNPHARSLKAEIDDANSQLEALTRIAHVMGQINRQVTVLEPVIARKVLPSQNQKFYQALRLISYLIHASLAEDQGKLISQNEQVQVTIVLSQLVKNKYPDQFKLTFGSSQNQNMDNSSMGNYAKVVLALEHASGILQDVQVMLRQYLEEKRLVFPRFYFLADQDVLEILASANQRPGPTLQPHMKKLFSSIEAIQLDNSASIVEFCSPESERIQLRQKIQTGGNAGPEVWLNRLDLAIKDTLKQELLQILALRPAGGSIANINQLKAGDQFQINTSYNKVKNEVSPYDKNSSNFYNSSDITVNLGDLKLFQKSSGEMFCLAMSIYYSAVVDKAMKQADSSNELKDVKNRLQSFLDIFSERLFAPEISSATFGQEQYVEQLKLKMVTTDITHYLSVVTEMINTTQEGRQQLWNRELKAKVYKATGDVYYLSLNIFLPYTFEYQGLPSRLIHTPLTTNCYSTLTSSIGNGKSSRCVGPAGTGKTESVKALAQMLGRACIVFNCDSALAREDLSRILAGIVLSGSVGCFDEVNRLSPSVLSAVSVDIENIQTGIELSVSKQSVSETAKHIMQYGISLGAQNIPLQSVSPFASVFVTMNPASREYRGRSELPFSLIRLLRCCWMGVADVNLIMAVQLQISGFKNYDMIAQKATLVYQLAQRRIPKEIHLDWGLRSLQSVIRQAALAKASLYRKIKVQQSEIMSTENRIMVKALSDATFSRVQGNSATLFKEILNDVFGNVEIKVQSKYGATSDTESVLAEKIDTQSEKIGILCLQLYRALIAKLGVVLLGQGGSGKTMIRKLLFQAIEKASDNKIKIQEYIISPKSMSREDLLGFVDPSTKEWNDGALTKAARLAVQANSAQSTGSVIWPVLVFDGDVDPEWIEALNSSLDDNRLLSLSSGERIRFPASCDPLEAQQIGAKKIPTPVTFLFETDSLEHASPATVSRLAVILVADLAKSEQLEIAQLRWPLVKNIAQIISNSQKMENPQQFLETITHLSLCIEQQNDAKSSDGNNEIRLLRCLCSELKGIEQNNVIKLCQIVGVDQSHLQNSCVTPAYADPNDKKLSPSQQWAVKLIQQFINFNHSVLVVGDSQSGKYHCIKQASNYKDQYQFVSVSCTKLMTRDEVINTIYSQCSEHQRVDGVKEIKPRSGKKLLVCIRNIDVCSADEYGHSQLYTLLWSIICHNKLFLHSGNAVEMKNIVICCTAISQHNIPARLRRLMGLVTIPYMQQKDIEIILGPFYRMAAIMEKKASFDEFIKKAVSQHEQHAITNNQVKNEEAKVIALPNLLPATRSINFSILIKLSQMKLDELSFILLYKYFFQSQCPLLTGQQAIETDIKRVSKSDTENNYLTAQKAGETAKNVLRYLQNNEPIKVPQKMSQLEQVSVKVRMNMLKELLDGSQDYVPGLKLFGKFIFNSPQQIQQKYLTYIAAMEAGLVYQQGLFVLTSSQCKQRDYSAECIIIAALITYHHVLFASGDKFSNGIIKMLGQQVAEGFSCICYIIDASVLEHDVNYIAFTAAIASGDTNFIKTRLSLADLRGLLSKYQECHNVKDDVTEQELTEIFLGEFLASVKIVLYVSPLSPLCDQIFTMAPSIKRSLQLVSLGIDESNINSVSEQIMPTMSKVLSEQLSKIGVQFDSSRHLLLFDMFVNYWKKELLTKKKRLSAGLQQLSIAQKEVDNLSKQAQVRQQKVQQAQNDANNALEQITQKMKIVQQNKEKAQMLEVELKKREGGIFREKEAAEKELEKVKPLVDEAQNAVSNIPNDAISEVKSFNSPPAAVAQVLEAVVLFMGGKDTSWKSLKGFISQQGIIKTIASYDPRKVPSGVIQKVADHVKNNPNAFNQQQIQRVSRAAAPLAKWVVATLSFVEIFKKIEPLMQKCEEANKSLIGLRQQLQGINDQVKQLENEAAQLKENFNKKTADLEVYKQELEAIDVRRRAGESMLNQLSGEKTRWTANDEEADKALSELNICAITAAKLYVDLGAKTDDIRDECIKERREIINNLNITQEFKDEAVKNKLSISRQSLENAVIIKQVFKDGIINTVVLSNVTEATGVLNYLKNVYQPQVLSANDENIANLLAIQARFGNLTIVTDCDAGSIPPAVIPYIRELTVIYGLSEASKAGIGGDDTQGDIKGLDVSLLKPKAILNVPGSGDKQVELNPNFKLILLSSVSIYVPQFLSNRLLCLSFAPTQKSRTDLYIDTILGVWSPETLNQIDELTQQQTKLRQQLSEIEDNLLQALRKAADSKVNILENKNLISTLDNAHKQNIQIQQAQEQSRSMQEHLDRQKGLVFQIAQTAERCLSALETMAQLNYLYIVDDSSILPILKSVLDDAKTKYSGQQINQQMVDYTINRFLQLMYIRVQNMVFADDKVGTCVILLKKTRPEIFTDDIYRFFTNQEIKISSKQPNWVGNNKRVQEAIELIPEEKRQAAQLYSDQIWGGFIENSRSAKENTTVLLPDSASQLNPLQKAALIVSVRPELMSQFLLSACEQMLLVDQDAHSVQQSPLQQALQLSAGMLQPIIIYASQGQDPSSSLGGTILALSPGKESIVDKQFQEALEEIQKGDTGKQQIIIIKGGHLCLQWLQVLPSKLTQYKADILSKNAENENIYKQIRIVILLEPKAGIPRGLSRISWRICTHQSSSPKSTMLNLLNELPEVSESVQAEVKRFFYELCYVACTVHTVLEARQAFIPRGVASDPGWNAQDALTLCGLLKSTVDFGVADFDILMRRARSLAIDSIYGVQVKDKADGLLVRNFINIAFSSEMQQILTQIVKAQQKSSSFGIQSLAAFGNHLETFSWLRWSVPEQLSGVQNNFQAIKAAMAQQAASSFPDGPNVGFLCLQAPALRLKAERDSLVTKSLLLHASSGLDEGNQGGDVYGAALRLQSIFIQVLNGDGKQRDNGNTGLKQAMQKYIEAKIDGSGPLMEELNAQLKTVKKNLVSIQKDLSLVEDASKSPLTASSKAKSIAKLISAGICPETWTTGFVAPPTSVAPIESPELATISPGSPEKFIALLPAASAAILAAGEALKDGGSGGIELQKFPAPASFVEAVRRHEGKRLSAPLDRVKVIAGTTPPTNTQTIQINAGSIVLAGAALSGTAGNSLDLTAPGASLPHIFIWSEKQENIDIRNGGIGIPFYIDRGRTAAVPALGSLVLQARVSEAAVSVAGLYAHLDGR